MRAEPPDAGPKLEFAAAGPVAAHSYIRSAGGAPEHAESRARRA